MAINCNCNFRACGVSVENITTHVLKVVLGLVYYIISSSTIRYMFVLPNKSRNSKHRYLSLADCKVLIETMVRYKKKMKWHISFIQELANSWNMKLILSKNYLVISDKRRCN